METLSFLDFVSQFESQIKAIFQIELLDLHYTPYSFGSGLVVYKIKGKTIRIVYDGRDNHIEAKFSKQHQKYPTCVWFNLFSGNPSEFMKNGVKFLIDEIS